MRIKRILKSLFPPCFLQTWSSIRYDQRQERTYPKPSEKTIAYSYIADMNRRSKLPFQNITELSKDYSFDEIRSISSDHDEANYYGSFLALQHYARMAIHNLPPQNFSIQHGIIYQMSKWEFDKRNLVNFVWSSKIADMYKNQFGVDRVFAVGAPFLYAESLLSTEEVMQERKRLGNNLLAIPMHSTHFKDKKYNPSHFINLLKDQKKQFDSIRVCLYWKDIQKGMAGIYQKAGFECVCCGHMFDQFFLQRQKSLYEIADATISNAIGSHVGYSVSMGKPHWIVPDEFELLDTEGGDGASEEMKSVLYSKNYKDILDAFIDNGSYLITDRQRSIVDDYWGVSNQLTRKEMNIVLSNLY